MDKNALIYLAYLIAAVLFILGLKGLTHPRSAVRGNLMGALGMFVVAGLPSAAEGSAANLAGIFPDRAGLPGLLEATALMFVSYTGYGRIATLGEEVRDPERTIPRAIVVTLVVSALLYVSVGAVAVGSVGAPRLAEMTASRAAPLEDAAMTFGGPTLGRILALGAITAMLGVILNLILGLSRVLLAMARRGDAPGRLATIDDVRSSPAAAVIAVGIVIGLLVLIGDVKTTWSFSAFTVLVYYALTNLAALRIPVEDRIFPRWIAVAGLTGCLGLAFWVEWRVWAVGLGMIAAGLVWQQVMRRLASRS